MHARALVAIVGTALGLGVAVPAGAADLPRMPTGDFRLQYSAPARAGMRVIADDQPGVIVRAYWREPWRHRHYYPATGRRPAVGRHENLSAGPRPLRPAQGFARHWWVSSVFMSELPEARGRDIGPEPPHK